MRGGETSEWRRAYPPMVSLAPRFGGVDFVCQGGTFMLLYSV